MWLDASITLRPDMPTYPGEDGPALDSLKAIARGDAADVRRLCMGLHTGTHVDAPGHFIAGAEGVDALPLDALVGPCRVVEVEADPDVSATALRAALGDRPPERLLLRTRNSRARPASWDRADFDEGFAALVPEGARWLVERGVRLVGVDYLSVEPYQAPEPFTHLALLGARVVIVEGLDLRAIPAGRYELFCLPIRLAGADGSPARVLLRPLHWPTDRDAYGTDRVNEPRETLDAAGRQSRSDLQRLVRRCGRPSWRGASGSRRGRQQPRRASRRHGMDPGRQR